MIDILMATYNGEEYLERQIDSIINQLYLKWRLIIRDDGSTDHTKKIVEKYMKKYPQKIFYYENNKNSGSAKKNFMNLLRDTDAEYIMFCDQDDVWDEDKIIRTYKSMKKIEKLEGKEVPLMIATDLRVVSSKEEVIDQSFRHYMNLPSDVTLSHLIIQNNITGCTIMMNRALCEMLKKALDTKKILMHDHFAAIVASLFGKVVLLKRSTISYRQHDSNTVGAMDARSLTYLIQRFKRGQKQFQQDLDDSMDQVGYILELYGDQIENDDVFRMLEKYSHLNKQSKWKKMHFFIKYKVYKHGMIRKIMQFVWC